MRIIIETEEEVVELVLNESTNINICRSDQILGLIFKADPSFRVLELKRTDKRLLK